MFELLQNADDNTFKRAKKINAPPFILFKVYADRIVIDCNEDGFESRHVKAICEVGDSTKSTSYGYTGAKGIGFKSVFIAAWRVYIQSGNFSFEFRHKKSESGLGMVRPIWVDASETLDGPLTRMTLYLHEEGDRSEVGHLQDVIFRQLGDLQNNCLLFLRRLERIGVEFYDKNGHLKTSRHIQKQKIDDHRVSVEEISTEDGEETFTSQIYHLTRKGATGLTASDNRQVPDTDDARLAFAKADVVLAFPLTDEYKPLISQGQDVFAFLPVRQLDYKVSQALAQP